MSYFLSPINSQIVDANGNPLSGGKIYTYQAGTTTLTATYTDSTGGTQQANPIILNSLGVPASPIWLNGGTTYKFVIKNSADVTQRTIDGITGVNDISTSASEWNESGFVPTYISATQFSVLGDQTSTLHVNRRVRTRNTGGYVYGRISVSAYGGSVTTVTVVNDSGTMDSGLSSVAYGFLSFTHASIPYAMYAGAGANADITSLSGLTNGIVGTSGDQTIGGIKTFSTQPVLPQKLTSGTTAATTSGSTVDFTSIPSWVRRITVALNGVSTNSSGILMLRLGAGGAPDTTGYSGGGSINTATPVATTSTAGLIMSGGGAAGYTYFGIATLVHMGSNLWAFSFVGGNTGVAAGFSSGGSKSLSGVLDRIQLTSSTGDTFDAGSINILYE